MATLPGLWHKACPLWPRSGFHGGNSLPTFPHALKFPGINLGKSVAGTQRGCAWPLVLLFVSTLGPNARKEEHSECLGLLPFVFWIWDRRRWCLLLG